jgi:CHAD domain-containing protein
MSPLRRYDLLRSRLDSFTRALPGVTSGEPRAIHRARVASRRLRELLPVLELDADTIRKVNRRLKKLTRRLGGVREIDVLTQLLEELQSARLAPLRALRRVGDEVREARDEAMSGFSHKSIAEGFHRANRKLEHIAEKLEKMDDRGSRGRSWRWAIDARVSRRAATLKTAITEAGSMYMPERLHVVRLALKKLRYGMELSCEAGGFAEAADVRLLKRGQDLLGLLRDRQVLIDRVRHVQASLDPPDMTAWRELDAIVLSLEHSCRSIHARYLQNQNRFLSLCDRFGARGSASAARRAV